MIGIIMALGVGSGWGLEFLGVEFWGRFCSFADAELAEDLVEDVGGGGFAGDFSEVAEGGAEVDGGEVFGEPEVLEGLLGIGDGLIGFSDGLVVAGDEVCGVGGEVAEGVADGLEEFGEPMAGDGGDGDGV